MMQHDNMGRERRMRRSPLDRIGNWLARNRDLVKAYVIFVVFTVVAFVALQTVWCADHILQPLNSATAGGSAWLMGLFGTEADHFGSQILSEAGSVNIAEGCNSAYATIIFLAGIFAFPTGWRQKLLGAILGTVALFVINLVRVVTLVYLSGSNKGLFDEAHLYIWQFAIILIGGLLWLLWYDKIVSRRPTSKNL
jgi:exosortase H (IPTLxxWG-CTERM-specific)